MLEGKLMMRLVQYDKLKIHQKYFIVHKLFFLDIEVWHREYIGIFKCYGVTNNIIFTILNSYDHVEMNKPHVGVKYWGKDATIRIYEMVPQGQQSMENRALSKILTSMLDEHYLIL